MRFHRLFLFAAAAALLLAARPWDGLQLDSRVARAEAAQSCALRPALWHGTALPPLPAAARPARELRAVTWNLHSGLGPDWSLYAPRAEVEARLRAIAGHIHAEAPDVVALNEVDFGSRRSGWLDQAAFLAAEFERLGGERWQVVSGETWRRDFPGLEVRFGNAALVRHPVVASRACLLGQPCGAEGAARYASTTPTGWLGRLAGEPRGVLEVDIDVHGRPVTLLVTHLEAFVVAKREGQAIELLERFAEPGRTTVLLGDVNTVDTRLTLARPHMAADRSHDLLGSGPLLDAREGLAAMAGREDLGAWATYPAEAPRWPLDGAFASPDLLPLSAQVIGTTESDHRGLAVRFAVVDGAPAAAYAAWQQALAAARAERLEQCDGYAPDQYRAGEALSAS